MDIFETLRELNACHGPSGDEAEIRDEISRRCVAFADEITSDTMGNLIVHKKGTGSKIMFSAHMDSIGFIVTHFEKEGFLRVGRVGGVDPKEVLYMPVRFKNGVNGVVIKDEKVEFGKLKMDDLLIDIGAKSEEEAKTLVMLGDTAVYDLTPKKLHANTVTSPYMDNRIACAILLGAMECLEKTNNDLYFVFSTQEEVGLRGARTATYAIAPDYGIAVDVTGTDDVPGADHSATTTFGKGAAIKVMDSSVICHTKVVEKLEQLGKEKNIATQREILTGGGTDAGAIHVTRSGVLTGGISIPCRYIHTPVETVNFDDVSACIELVKAFAEAEI